MCGHSLLQARSQTDAACLQDSHLSDSGESAPVVNVKQHTSEHDVTTASGFVVPNQQTLFQLVG